MRGLHSTNTSINDLQACEAWASTPLSELAVKSSCPLKTRVGLRAELLGDGVYSVPRDAIDLCKFIHALQKASKLPTTQTELASKLLVDVGAAFGGELMIGRALGFSIASFEARPSEFAILEASYGNLSHSKLTNAAVSNVGLGANQRVTIYNADDSSSLHRSALIPKAAERKAKLVSEKSSTVRAVSLDYAFRSQLGAVGLLKIDTQGHEFEVLASGIEMLRASRPILAFEYNPTFRVGREEHVARSLCLLRSLGFYRCHLHRHRRMPVSVDCVPRTLAETPAPSTPGEVMDLLRKDLDDGQKGRRLTDLTLAV